MKLESFRRNVKFLLCRKKINLYVFVYPTIRISVYQNSIYSISNLSANQCHNDLNYCIVAAKIDKQSIITIYCK